MLSQFIFNWIEPRWYDARIIHIWETPIVMIWRTVGYQAYHSFLPSACHHRPNPQWYCASHLFHYVDIVLEWCHGVVY